MVFTAVLYPSGNLIRQGLTLMSEWALNAKLFNDFNNSKTFVATKTTQQGYFFIAGSPDAPQ